MVSKNKSKRLKVAQSQGLIVSIGEASKLLGVDGKNMSDDDVAWQILCLSQLATMLIKTMDLQENNYNCINGV